MRITLIALLAELGTIPTEILDNAYYGARGAHVLLASGRGLRSELGICELHPTSCQNTDTYIAVSMVVMPFILPRYRGIAMCQPLSGFSTR